MLTSYDDDDSNLNLGGSKQPWSTYAVYQTTLLQWALFWDCLLLYLYTESTETWSGESYTLGLGILLTWMLLSKFLKLLGHYTRHPVDIFLLPVSISFGYLHGIIKAKAMLSLNVVSQNKASSPSSPSRRDLPLSICPCQHLTD